MKNLGPFYKTIRTYVNASRVDTALISKFKSNKELLEKKTIERKKYLEGLTP
jgi:hypothetical protein